MESAARSPLLYQMTPNPTPKGTSPLPFFTCPTSAAFGVCAYCDLCANAAAALVVLLTGIQCAPSWDRPWLQTSLSDFWGRRWNMPAAASLKELVYDPIVEGRRLSWSKHRNVGSHSTKRGWATQSVLRPTVSVSDAETPTTRSGPETCLTSC